MEERHCRLLQRSTDCRLMLHRSNQCCRMRRPRRVHRRVPQLFPPRPLQVRLRLRLRPSATCRRRPSVCLRPHFWILHGVPLVSAWRRGAQRCDETDGQGAHEERQAGPVHAGAAFTRQAVARRPGELACLAPCALDFQETSNEIRKEEPTKYALPFRR
jgi:hypothetical protein